MPTSGLPEPSPNRPAKCPVPDTLEPASRRRWPAKPPPRPATIFLKWCIAVEQGISPTADRPRPGDDGPAGRGRPPGRVPGLHHPGAAALQPGGRVRPAQPPPAPDRPRSVPVPATWPAVDVVVPCFNEDPSLLEACCRSVAARTIRAAACLAGRRLPQPGGAAGRLRALGRAGLDVRLLDANAGKRAAQDEAVRRGTGELVVLMDSDTVLARDAIRHAAATFADDRVGAVSGSIGVLNAPTNLLTRLIHHRYRLRFQVERPAQGFFTSLLCCSGPFAVYRRSLLDELWEGYLGQTFAGVRCTNGDDLHLTNLVLATGHQVLFEPRAIASTRVPGRSASTCASSCAGTAASTGSCAGPSPASGPGTPTWPWTCWPGPCCPCCWPPPSCCWRRGAAGRLGGAGHRPQPGPGHAHRHGRVPAGARGQRPVPAAVRAAACGPAGPGPGLRPGHTLARPALPVGETSAAGRQVSCGSGPAAAGRCAPRPRCPSP